MFCGLGVVYLPCGPPLLFFIWGVGDIGYTSITIKKKWSIVQVRTVVGARGGASKRFLGLETTRWYV